MKPGPISIIAYDLKGVSAPLTPPNTAEFLKFKLRFELGVELDKHVFHHFLRINNRKKFFNVEDFVKAGYTDVDTKYRNLTLELHDWLEQLEHRFVNIYGHFFFAEESDRILFLMKWQT